MAKVPSRASLSKCNASGNEIGAIGFIALLTTMDRELRLNVERNLYEFARPAVEPWDDFPWHKDGNGECDTWKLHSSQALAIDLFGTIRMLSQFDRDRVLGELAAELGLPAAGPWDIQLEWIDPRKYLREPRQTQIDARASSSGAVILFECKFTEASGGCSQPGKVARGRHRGLMQCNGSYSAQLNPVNGISSPCALTGKGIRYWDVIPDVFNLNATETYVPCPFRGPWYQWMRNLVLHRKFEGQRGAQRV